MPIGAGSVAPAAIELRTARADAGGDQLEPLLGQVEGRGPQEAVEAVLLAVDGVGFLFETERDRVTVHRLHLRGQSGLLDLSLVERRRLAADVVDQVGARDPIHNRAGRSCLAPTVGFGEELPASALVNHAKS